LETLVEKEGSVNFNMGAKDLERGGEEGVEGGKKRHDGKMKESSGGVLG